MKEILFRGKRTDNGKWVEGMLARYNPELEVANMLDEFEILVPVNTKTVGQFTGLTDKNGKKIFEGDYFIAPDEDDLLFVVEFRNGQFCFVTYGIRGALMEYGWDETAGGFGECDCLPMSDYNIETIAIDGTIHDNPEVAKEVKE